MPAWRPPWQPSLQGIDTHAPRRPAGWWRRPGRGGGSSNTPDSCGRSGDCQQTKLVRQLLGGPGAAAGAGGARGTPRGGAGVLGRWQGVGAAISPSSTRDQPYPNANPLTQCPSFTAFLLPLPCQPLPLKHWRRRRNYYPTSPTLLWT